MITAQKYYYNGSVFLFVCSDGMVRDEDGCEWVKEWYRGCSYYRKTGSTYRIAKTTLMRKSKPCNVLN